MAAGALDAAAGGAGRSATPKRACAIELRVSIAGLFWGDPQRVAEKAFRRLGMAATGRRNGILLLIVPPGGARWWSFADQGITARSTRPSGPAWCTTVTAAFRQARYTEGMVAAVDALARHLAPLFPPLPGDVNELPDGSTGALTPRAPPARGSPRQG